MPTAGTVSFINSPSSSALSRSLHTSRHGFAVSLCNLSFGVMLAPSRQLEQMW